MFLNTSGLVGILKVEKMILSSVVLDGVPSPSGAQLRWQKARSASVSIIRLEIANLNRDLLQGFCMLVVSGCRPSRWPDHLQARYSAMYGEWTAVSCCGGRCLAVWYDFRLAQRLSVGTASIGASLTLLCGNIIVSRFVLGSGTFL